jgi:hypothetical protein
MEYLVTYLLIGAVTAAFTAFVQLRERSRGRSAPAPDGDLFVAYIFIALAWPVSIAAFVYGLSRYLVAGPAGDEGKP